MDTLKLSPQAGQGHKSGNSLFYIGAAILILAYLIYQPGIMSIEQILNMGESLETKTAIYILSVLIMLLCALTPIPAELIALANTFMFSPTEAFFITWISALLGAQIGYEFGRLSNLNPCRDRDNNRICHWLNQHGYKSLAFMRLIPVVPFFALNICGGILKLQRGKYMAITALTIIPAVAILTYFPHVFT